MKTTFTSFLIVVMMYVWMRDEQQHEILVAQILKLELKLVRGENRNISSSFVN